MNYKQKLGYMVLGAAMPLVGMAVSIFSPSLNAQKRGEYIVYTGLTVVDGKGNDAIRFTVGENRNLIVVYDKKGKRAIGLHTGETGTGIIVFDKAGNAAIGLGFDETRGNEIRLSDKAGGATIGLRADQTINRISVYDKTGKKGVSTLYADEIGSNLIIYDQPTNVTRFINRRIKDLQEDSLTTEEEIR